MAWRLISRIVPNARRTWYQSPVTEESQAPRPVQRLRLTFSKDGPARYISHLDLARALERALNRAALPVAYTQGFNRRPRLALAAALPLGYTSAAEVADVWLTEAMAPEVFGARLMARMAPGIVISDVAQVPLVAPSLQQQLAESVYEVGFPDGVDGEGLRRSVAELLAAGSLMRERRRPKDSRPQTFDLRPLLLDVAVEEDEDGAPRLRLRLVQSATQTARPGTTLADLAALKTPFRPHGRITAGNSAGLNDGATACLLASAETAAELGLPTRMRLVGYAFAGVEPEVMGVGPVPATEKALARAGMSIEDIGLFEVNEAFAVQVLAFLDHFGIADDDERVNPDGGAIAVGHPLASSGVRLMTQLARHFEARPQVRYGLTTMCIGIGMGGTVIWENPHHADYGKERAA